MTMQGKKWVHILGAQAQLRCAFDNYAWCLTESSPLTILGEGISSIYVHYAFNTRKRSGISLFINAFVCQVWNAAHQLFGFVLMMPCSLFGVLAALSHCWDLLNVKYYEGLLTLQFYGPYVVKGTIKPLTICHDWFVGFPMFPGFTFSSVYQVTFLVSCP